MYSGALGFLAVNGTADLSVVIRTLVAAPGGLTIGAGGAIVAGSDPEDELEEMLLKAAPAARGGRRVARDRVNGARSPTNGAAHRANGTSAPIPAGTPSTGLRSTSGSERLKCGCSRSPREQSTRGEIS